MQTADAAAQPISPASPALDPRFVSEWSSEAAARLNPPPAGRSRCALCLSVFTPSPERDPLFCGPVCERLAVVQIRMADGLCPWCAQASPDGPHVVTASSEQSSRIVVERDTPCRPGIAGQAGRLYTQSNDGLIEMCRCGQSGTKAWNMYHKPWCRNKLVEDAGWRCGLCGEAIDPLLSPMNQMGLTFDHILEAGKGGSKHDNLRPAHRLCNTKRGMSMTVGTARLIDAVAGAKRGVLPIETLAKKLGLGGIATMVTVAAAMTELAPGAVVWSEGVVSLGVRGNARHLRGGAQYTLCRAKYERRKARASAPAENAAAA